MKSNPGTIGITPPGALGVGFFFHLTKELQQVDGNVYFIGLDGSKSINELRENELCISTENGVRRFPGEALIVQTLATAGSTRRLPEILLVCPNPDQLLGVINSLVDLLERLSAENGLQLETGGKLAFPIVVFSSNGIYFQRIRQLFVEKLEESMLFGRLPDLWPGLMPAIVGHLLRGVTTQTGLREGSGARTLYRPGKRGPSRLAGGDPVLRERCAKLLADRGAWFDLATDSSPTRLEFDKGIINLISNFVGLIHAFQEDGSFSLLRVNQILAPENDSEIKELAAQVFAVGLAVRAYGPSDTFEKVLLDALAMCRHNAEHIPSSLQLIDLRIRQGELTAEFTPTEEWLITPLIKYARSAGLGEAEAYFESLRQRLAAKLALGMVRYGGSNAPSRSAG